MAKKKTASRKVMTKTGRKGRPLSRLLKATKKPLYPPSLRKKHPHIDWKKAEIAGRWHEKSKKKEAAIKKRDTTRAEEKRAVARKESRLRGAKSNIALRGQRSVSIARKISSAKLTKKKPIIKRRKK